MQTTAVVFTAPGQVTYGSADVQPDAKETSPILIQTEASVVSPGTELAVLSGKEAWAPLPYVPGYGSVGRVMQPHNGWREGDRVFTHGKHVACGYSQFLVVRVPQELDATDAVFARIGQVSMTALRVAEYQIGDYIAVIGLGPVGNLAAQLFSLAGCEVIGVDVSQGRRTCASACGIEHVLEGGPALPEQVKQITHGRMCRCVVDASGVAQVVESAAALAAPLGELILLGSPRRPYQTDLTAFLNKSHLWGNGCLTIKGAHEWRLPIEPDPSGRQRYSMAGNVECLFRLLCARRLHIAPLKTHVLNPAQAPAVYEGLTHRKDEYAGVVFDWR